nr:MAG TPA: hypothetical protein [Caudoviricetes sp.]
MLISTKLYNKIFRVIFNILEYDFRNIKLNLKIV